LGKEFKESQEFKEFKERSQEPESRSQEALGLRRVGAEGSRFGMSLQAL
jgi:hypothetical protein